MFSILLALLNKNETRLTVSYSMHLLVSCLYKNPAERSYLYLNLREGIV